MHACAPGVNAMVKLYVLPKDTGQGRAVHPGMLKESILAFGGGTLAARSEIERESMEWMTRDRMAFSYSVWRYLPHAT